MGDGGASTNGASRELATRLAEFWQDQGFAINWTAGKTGEDAKRCLTVDWPNTQPLAGDRDYVAGIIGQRLQTRNPIMVCRPSGAIVIESDSIQDRDQLLALGLPPTLVARSSAPGKLHFYYRAPQAGLPYVAFRFESGKITADRERYFVIAPALHPSGVPYEWENFGTQIAELPLERFHELVAAAGADSREHAILAANPDAIILPGQRTQHIAALAGSHRRFGVPLEDSLQQALKVNETRFGTQPLTPAKVRATVHGIYGRYPDGISAGDVQGSGTPEQAPDAPAPLLLLTAREISELPEPPIEDQLLGPLVVKGQRLVLGAHTGEGKTTFTLEITRAIVNGGPFLDWTAAGGARVLIIDAEQGLRTIKRRLREAGIDTSDNVDYLRVPDGLALDTDPQHIAELDRILHNGYDLVAADPLYKLHTGDSNAEREAVDLMKRFDTWRDQHGFALMLPVHCRKPLPGTKFSIHDLFGSSAYVRGAEVVCGLQRIADGYAKLHFLKDRDGDLPISTSWGLLFDREQGFRRDPNDGKRETAADKVRAALEEDSGLTEAALMERTGYAERTIRSALKEIGATSHGVGNQHEPKLWELEPDQNEPETGPHTI